MRVTVEERFWSKVAVADIGCWEWLGALHHSGYGAFNLDGQMRAAHRVAYELVVGPVPEGLQLDHLCANRACVRVPDHLEPVTGRENLLRGATIIAGYAARTHCGAGHPFDEANTRRGENGRRRCRTCDREWHRRRK